MSPVLMNTGDPMVEVPDGTPPPKGSTPDVGEARKSLLDIEPQQAASRMVREWEASGKLVRPLMAQWKVNRARTLGYSNIQLIKVQDEARAYFPMGSAPNPKLLNKARTLCRRIRSLIFADPAQPEAMPANDEDASVDAAEFATRVLEYETERMAFNLVAGDAFDVASDYASAFVWIWPDPTAGGWRPREVQAVPGALTVDTATVDPATGKDADPNTLVVRYVKTDGTLTDTREDPAVDQQWQPGLRRQILTGKQVRMLPPTCRDIWDADGVMIGAMLPLGMLRGLFGKGQTLPDGTVTKGLDDLNDEELQALASYQPKDAKDLLPAGYKLNRGAAVTDETLVFCLSRYHVSSPSYAKGFYGVVVGQDTLAYRGPWFDETHIEPMDLPLTQFEQVHDEDQPYGHGMMEFLGPGNEVIASMVDTMLTHLERLANRRIFLPLMSPMSEEQLQSPTGTVLRIVPGMEPKYEDVPPFPPTVMETFQMWSGILDSESGLQQQAQAVNDSSVTSGVQAQTIIEQVRVIMSDLIQHTERALIRGWRIMQQEMRATYTVPQKMRFSGEDGTYRERSWTQSDLGNSHDVQLRRGSFTQLSQTAKASLVAAYQQAGYLSAEDAEHAITGNVGGLIGLQDNPHRLRVKTQIATWREGPPEGWQPPPPQVNPQTGQPQAVADPANPFQPRAVDVEPNDAKSLNGVAKLRAYELGRALASKRAQKMPPAWLGYLEAEYERCRKAANMATVSELQAGQQQAAQTAAQTEAAKLAVDKAKIPPPKTLTESLNIKGADLDPQQTWEVLTRAGIQISPPTVPMTPPEADGARPADGQPAIHPALSGIPHLQIMASDTRKRANRYTITRDPLTGHVSGGQLFADAEPVGNVTAERDAQGNLVGGSVA